MSEKSNDAASLGPSNRTLSIFLVSALGLFLEMLFIRWIGTEIRIFAYLQNTILVTCFLGLGIGCFTSRQPINIRGTLLPLLGIVVILSNPLLLRGARGISQLLSTLQDFVIWAPTITGSAFETILFVVLGLGLTFGLMLLILDSFVPIGRLLGRLMDDHPRTIWAYSANVAGSLAGIWLFVVLSTWYSAPIIWSAVLGTMLLFFVGRPWVNQKLNLAIVVLIVLLSSLSGVEPSSLEVVWSPYQKLVLRETDAKKGEIGKYQLEVNNVNYQEILDLRHDDPTVPNVSDGALNQYAIPMMLHPKSRKVLIVGAGTGNDVAAALRYGATEVAAVEIDPAIVSVGRRYHPEKPYDSPRVRTVITDARAFFAQSTEKYDVISFGLLDAHTATAMTNARLDHYVYTRESMQKAYSLLADGGS